MFYPPFKSENLQIIKRPSARRWCHLKNRCCRKDSWVSASFTEGSVSPSANMSSREAGLSSTCAAGLLFFSLAKAKDFEEQRPHSRLKTNDFSHCYEFIHGRIGAVRTAFSKQWGHSAWMQDSFVLSFVFAEVTLFQVFQRAQEESLPSDVFKC